MFEPIIKGNELQTRSAKTTTLCTDKEQS